MIASVVVSHRYLTVEVCKQHNKSIHASKNYSGHMTLIDDGMTTKDTQSWGLGTLKICIW